MTIFQRESYREKRTNLKGCGVLEKRKMRVNRRIIFLIFGVISVLGPGLGCASDQRFEQGIDVAGVASRLIKEAPVAKKLNDAELSAFENTISLFRHTHVASSSIQTLKPRFAAYLVQAIVKSGGIHPDQLHRVLRQVLDLKMDACGGGSCGKVLGIRPDEINDFLDEILQKIEKSYEDEASHLSESQIKILASSLKRPPMVWRVHDFEVPVPAPRPKSSMPEFDGLCPLALVQSVGFRSNNAIEMREMRISASKTTESIDYRRKESRRHQGASGACHTFAMAALLSHSKYSQIVSGRRLSPERLLIENWAINLGKSPQEAAKKDLEKLHRLAAEFRQAREVGGDLSSLTPEEATKKFINQHYVELTIKDQGGNALRNWSHISKQGALTDDAAVPKLSMAEIEDLTRNIARARIHAIRSILMFDLDRVSSEGLARSLITAYEPIFARAKEGQLVSRGDIRRELSRFKLKSRDFRRDRTEESLGGLIKDLIEYGPVHAATSNHAFTIVGFDAKKRRFYVRDSQHIDGLDYEEVPLDELASSLSSYQVIEPI